MRGKLQVYPQKKKVKLFNSLKEKRMLYEALGELIFRSTEIKVEPHKYSWSIDKTN